MGQDTGDVVEETGAAVFCSFLPPSQSPHLSMPEGAPLKLSVECGNCGDPGSK